MKHDSSQTLSVKGKQLYPLNNQNKFECWFINNRQAFMIQNQSLTKVSLVAEQDEF